MLGMTVDRQHSGGRALRGVALLVPLLLVGWWLVSRVPRQPTRFDDELDRALAPVMAQSELRREVSRLTSSQARLVARDLAERSIPYLGARDLELWAQVRARVARASPVSCAKLWKGGDESFLGPAIADLGPTTLEAYVQMLARALARRSELMRSEQKPPPSPSPGALARGFAAIAEQLPAEARADFERDVARSDVTDARGCRLFLTVSDGAERLPPTQRREFYEALANALQVPRGAGGASATPSARSGR